MDSRDNTPVKQLKGDVAEFFIGHTFNVNAALNHSESRVDIIRSNVSISRYGRYCW